MFFFHRKKKKQRFSSPLQVEHAERLRLESKRNEELEKKILQINADHAQRMSENETQLADLAEQIGQIEKQR